MWTVPLERITVEARKLRFWRTVLTAIAAVLWAVGWLVGHLFIVLWAAVAWSAAAVKVGWRDAHDRGS